MTLGSALLTAWLAALATDASHAPAQPAAAQTAPSKEATAPAKKGKVIHPPRASLPTVTGTVAEVDHRAHRLRLVTSTGELVLGFDRNTLVSGATGAVTPLQIAPGAAVKVGRDGDARAAWVELQIAPSTPKAAP